MNIGAFDLENSPILSWHWGRWGQDIRPIQTVEESRVLCFGFKWVRHGDRRKQGKYTFRAAYEHGRKDMLETVRDLLNEADAVTSWNGVRHDSKKIKTEFILEGMEPPSPWKEVDLMKAVKNQFMFSSNSLDHVAKELGVGEKVKHEGFFEIIPKVMGGDEKARKRFSAYQRQDVELLHKLYDRLLPWIPASMHPNLALGRAGLVCPYCEGTNLHSRGVNASAAGSYPKYQCQDCKKWSSERTRMSAATLKAI